MRIWLNGKGQKQVKYKQLDCAGKKQEREFLGNVGVETDEASGKKFIQFHENPMDPAAPEPNIPQDIIERVTFKGSIHRGFRTEGLYRHEGATLMLLNKERVHSEMMCYTIEREQWQEISISAPTIASLRAIYTMIRQGKLLPEEEWEPKRAVAKPVESSEVPTSTTGPASKM